MNLCDPDFSYCILPPYGAEFRDVAGWDARWRDGYAGRYQFWPGFAGGGILAAPRAVPERQRYRIATADVVCSLDSPYGLVLGNDSGQELARCVLCAIPERPHALVVRLGLAERVPDPTVTATAEHAEGLDGGRYLLVVPRKGRRSVKLMEHLPAWFGTFGVAIEEPLAEVPTALRAAMRDWFADPERLMFALPMAGGEGNAAWQLAVVYYAALHWDIQSRGLDSVHFVAEIEGRPNFRENWASNR